MIYLNLHPYIGLAAVEEKARIEFKLVSDFSFLLTSKEEMTFKSNNETLRFDYNREHQENDIRIGFGSSVYYKRFIFNLEYLLGVVNFDPDKNSPLVDVSNSIYSKVIRFGFGYLIFKGPERE